jgi:hypothetical protein
MKSRRCLLGSTLLALLLTASVSRGQVIFNDNFNGSSLTTNDGAGSVNPTSNTTAFNANGNSGMVAQGSGGAQYTPGGGYAEQDLSTVTGTTSNGFAYGLGATGTDFSITVNNINVTGNGGGRSDIPNSNNGGFRFELGIVSANASYGDPEVYNNTSGGVYINLFYDQQGNLTGDLRLTDSSKNGQYDSAGTTGIYDLASFTIPQGAGTTTSYTGPLTVTFDLTSTGYAISFNQTADVSSGSLSGTFTSLEQSDFTNGVRANLLGQGFSNGDGSGDISEFEVAVAPEPPVVYLLGFGLLALGFFGFRRAAVRA